ncbi:hypothetical protein HDU97_000927 [Phlyctochytrium planicorne]|nr:hypothetical protein HDU97_000927 [Phlyctochytrium planicorne]
MQGLLLLSALAWTALSVHAGNVYNAGELGDPLFPNVIDFTQCTVRKALQSENFLLGDSSLGEGCALPDSAHFGIPNKDGTAAVPFKDAEWDVVINKPSSNSTLLNIISPTKRPVYYCFSRGYLAREVDPPKPGDVNAALDPAHSTFNLDLAFVRKVTVPSKYLSKIDKSVMAYALIVRNVPNPYDTELLTLQNQFIQVAYVEYFDGNKKSLGFTNGSYFDATVGIKDFDDILPGTRSMEIGFFTNYPYYAVGQISMMMIQRGAEFRDLAQKAANITFIASLSFVLAVPIIMILEDVLRKRAPTLKLLDLVHYQGPKYIRALTYTLMMALLYMIFKWLQATDDTSEYSQIPLFGGISATAFSKQPVLKTMKTVIFIGVFISVGVVFWPIFVCYAHAASGSRVGAALGTITCLNLIILRLSLEYITASPILGYARRFASEVPEVFAYVCVLLYFAVNAASPTYVQNTYRKTHFKDLIYVRSLLRPVKVPSNPQPAEEEKERSMVRKYFPALYFRDNRPIWLRGRKDQDTTFDKLRNFMRYGRTPARMAAAIMMMCLFTYFLLIAQVFTVIDANASLSCTLALFGEGLTQAFSTVSSLLGSFTASQSFGSTLSSTLFELGGQIKSETEGDVLDLFYNLIFYSVIGAMTISLAVLIFNILDFCLTFQKDIKYLRVGNYSRLDGVSEPSTSSAMQFMGIQIGFAFVGSLYLMLISQILCFTLALFIKFKFIRDLLWRFILQNGLIFVAAIVGVVLSMAQKYVIEIFYVAKLRNPYREVPVGSRIEPDSKKGEPMVIINTRFWLQRITSYNHLDYFFLFPNLISGLLSFLGNLIKMIIGSAIFAYRLDKKTEYTIPLVASQSSIYFSWLLQEHHHSNPVIIIFTNILHTWAKHAPVSSTSSPDMLKGWGEPRPVFSSLSRQEQHTRRIQQKWAVIYTLVRNLQLAKFRKHVVRETYLKEYIAHTEAPLLREQEVQRVRQQNKLYEQAKAALRSREVEIWAKQSEAFGSKDGYGKSDQGHVATVQSQPNLYYPTPQAQFVPVPPSQQSRPVTSSVYQQPISTTSSPSSFASNQYYPRSPPVQQTPSFSSTTAPSPNHYDLPGSPAAVAAARAAAASSSSSSDFLVSSESQGQSDFYGMGNQQAPSYPSAPPRGSSRPS